MYSCFARHLLLFVLIVHSQRAFPQSTKIDSLKSAVRSQRDTLQINALIQLSYALLDSQRPDSALHYASNALELSKALQFERGLMRSHYALGAAFQERGAYTRSMGHFIQSLGFIEDHGSQSDLAGIYMYLARNHRLRAESARSLDGMPEALLNYRRALKFSEMAGNKPMVAGLQTELGFTFRYRLMLTNSQSDRDSTLYYFNVARYSLKIEKDLDGELGALLNLSSFYLFIKDYEEAERCTRELLSLAQRNDKNYFLPVVYKNLGTISFLKGDYKKSIDYREQSIEAAAKFEGVFSDPLPTYLDLAHVYNVMGKYPLAIKHYQLVLTGAQTRRLTDESVAWAYGGLSDVYYKLGEFKKSIEHHRKFSQLNDSLSKEIASAEIMRLQKQYEQSKQDDRIDVLEKEAGANKVVIQRTKIIQYLIAGILLMAVLVIVVLTNQYRTIRRAKKTQEDLFRQVDALKSRFFANISHEFRTPLTLLLGPIENRLAKAVDATDKKDLTIMHNNASRLLTLVNQLLDLSRLEGGSLRLRSHQVSLNKLIESISSQFASMADSRSINFQIDTSEPVDLFADSEKLEKIITNLLANAFKFTVASGTIQLKISKGIPDKQFPAGSAEIIVRDTGIGINENDLPKIFDRFFQVDNTATRQYGGSGIGLALVKELVELHHGSVAVESTLGEGTCFIIRLHLGNMHLSSEEIVLAGEELHQTLPKAIPDPVHNDMNGPEAESSKPNILIIEDNADLRYYLRSCLSEKFNVIESQDGTDGYARAVELVPDLIVSDLMMPGMDGIQLCGKLKNDEKTSHVPVVLLTAKADHSTKLEGLRTGADDYITKPFSPDELTTRVHNLIAIRKNLQQKYACQLNLRPSQIEVDSMEDRFVKKVMIIIEQHMDDTSLSVDLLAREAAMSNVQLYRKLKSVTGFTPNELIRNTRLERAASLLKQRAGNVADIAYLVGFNNLSYFSKCFREKFGSSPSEYLSQRIDSTTP